MLAQRRPDEQVYVGPTSVSNVGPTESTTEKLRWPNVVMLSGYVLGKAKIEKWLLEQESYAVHREERSKFKRRRVKVPYKGYQLDADTADMSFYQSSNGDINILLYL